MPPGKIVAHRALLVNLRASFFAILSVKDMRYYSILDLYSRPLGTWGKLAVVFFYCSNWRIIRLLPYLFLSWPSRRRSSARDRGVALYCSLLLNRSLEVQADLYLKAPSCKVFIWSLSVCMLVTPQIRLSYNRSNMQIATHKHLLVSIVGGTREFSRSFLYSTHSMVCQNHGL